MQAALEDPKVDINKAYRDKTLTEADIKDTNYAFKQAALGPRYQGTPAYISQADILQPIAPIINARSDTFLIRTYGEALAPDGKTVLAKAWCEAVVQRYPEYLNPQDKPETPVTTTSLQPENKKFGRRFIVKNYRGLHPLKSETSSSPMIRALVTILFIGLFPNSSSPKTAKQDTKIQFSVTRFDPRDRPIPEFMMKDGAHGNPVAGAFDLYRRAVHRHLEGGQTPRFLQTRHRGAGPFHGGSARLQKDLLLVFIPVNESFEILKIHVPTSGIKGGDHYVINATTTDVSIKFGSPNR